MRLDDFDDQGFVDALAGIYEHSRWVAERVVGARPFGSVDALAGAMARAVADASEAEREALIRAHPDLGTRLAVAEHSRAEQAGLGLDRLPPDEFERFSALNRAYRERFGFPFIIAVRRQSRASILAAFERRLGNDPQTERRAALAEIDAIARFRLEQLTGG